MEKLIFRPIIHKDPLWNETIDFAQNCSWKAGPQLAAGMVNNTFTDWERVFIAVAHTKVIGFCTLAKTDCIPDLNVSPYIGYVFVDEASRGNRVSQGLIHCACEYAQSLGFEKVYLLSREEGLYEKYGFNKIDIVSDSNGEFEQLFCKEVISGITIKRMDKKDIQLIQPLWEKLNKIHLNDSVHFKDHFRQLTFVERCKNLVFKDPSQLLIEVLFQEKNPVGYCISSIEGNRGEIESLFVEESFRKTGYGEKIVKQALNWLESNHCEHIDVSVAAGHESVLGFYERFGFKPRMTILRRVSKTD